MHINDIARIKSGSKRFGQVYFADYVEVKEFAEVEESEALQQANREIEQAEFMLA